MPPIVLHNVSGRQLLLLCWLLLSIAAYAQDGSTRFDHLSIDDGLSHYIVNDIVQDRLGFIWIATPDGLNRYDGYTIHTYRHDPSDSTSLIANSTNALYVARDSTLWVGSFDGLNRYDRACDCFRTYQHHPEDSTTLSVNYVSAICEDRRGFLWVGTPGGLNRLDPSSGEFRRFTMQRGRPFALRWNNVNAICRDPRPGSDIMWISTFGAGINRLDTRSGRFTYWFLPPAEVQRMLISYGETMDSMAARLQSGGALLAEIQANADSTRQESLFEVTAGQTRCLVMATGEAIGRQAYDEGWMVDAAGRTVWRFDPQIARHAGGHPKNRRHDALVTLKPGSYRLCYQTDGSHSPAGWNANPPRPGHPWGIRVFALDDGSQRALQRAIKDERVPQYPLSNRVMSLYADSAMVDGEMQYYLWAGTLDAGLMRIHLPSSPMMDSEDYHDQRHLTVTSPGGEGAATNRLGSNQILDVQRDRQGALWVATGGGGLAQMTSGMMETGAYRFFRYRHDPFRATSLSANYVTRVMEDRTGCLWIATGNGLNKLNQRKLQFKYFARSDDPRPDERGLPANSVSAIHEDGRGRMWIATGAGGISRFDPHSGAYRHFRPGGTAEASLPGQEICAIAQVQGGDADVLWLGSRGGGLIKFDTRQETFTRFRASETETQGLSSNVVHALCSDQDGGLWVGTGGGGLNKFDPRGETFETYLIRDNEGAPPASKRLLSNEVWSLLADPTESQPVIWIGTIGGGLSRLDVRRKTFTHFMDRKEEPHSINNISIPSLHIDAHGTLWVGTYSGGLNRFNRTSQTFTHYTVHDGLPNNMIRAILEDDHGRLWLSTNLGLSCFDPLSEMFRNYDKNDGLQSNIFGMGAGARSRDGKLFFGGINGFNCFHPDSLIIANEPPPVVLTDFRKFDRSVSFDRPLADLDRIELDYHENFFSFEFVTLDYANPQRNRYAYQLVGVDRDWVYSGRRRYASYTNLDPGAYLFRVKGANSDGVWNESGAEVRVLIHPPFWRTWWFYVLSAALLAASLYAIHAYRVRVKINRMVEIERVRKKAAADFHDELGHKLTRVSLFAELMRRNLGGASPENLDYLNRISDISGTLYNGMRDFLWTLDPEKDSLYEVAIRLKDFGDEFFDKTGAGFEVAGINDALRKVNLTMDWKRHLVLLFKEAMNNILKHAESRHVQLSFQVLGNEVIIQLADDGKGMCNSAEATGGRGIENMKTRAHKLNSHLEIHHRESGGTVVEFRGHASAH